MIRFGIIGTSGFVRGAYLTSIKKTEGAVAEAICARNEGRLNQVADEFNIPLRFTNYDEMIHSDRVDAVAVVTPNVMHYPMTMAALKAGKHIICDKPMAMNFDEALQMLQLAEEKNLINMIPFTWRFNPAAIYLKELTEKGFIGKIRMVDAVYVGDWYADPNSHFAWRMDKNLSGTGALGDIGSHLISLVESFCGRISSVVGDLQTFNKSRKDPVTGQPREITADETAMFLARFVSGAQGTFHTTCAGQGRDSYIRVELYGETGSATLLIDIQRGKKQVGEIWEGRMGSGILRPVELPSRLTEGFDIEENKSRIFDGVIGTFVNSINTGVPAVPGFDEGVQNQAVLDAVELSSRERRWVDVRKFL